jgi:hypothetical protein
VSRPVPPFESTKDSFSALEVVNWAKTGPKKSKAPNCARGLGFRPPAPGDPTRPQPDGITRLDADGQYLHIWFCPVDPLLPSVLALCPAVLAFFRLRFAPFLLSRQAEEAFWQDLALQGHIPDAPRPLALYRLCSDELVKDSLGPVPWHVACVDPPTMSGLGNGRMHSRSRTAFLAILALELSAVAPQATPLRRSSSTTTTSASVTTTLADPLQVCVCVSVSVCMYMLVIW